MKSESKGANLRSLVAILCVVALVPGDTLAYAPQQPPPPASHPATGSAKIPPEQLDSLVAPIALYPDPLLAQVLAASTYPLEIILLQRWLEKNKNLKDKALADAVAKQPWDPSVQALAGLPEVVKRLARRHSVDHRSGQRLSGAAERRDGCRSAHAQKGPGQRQFENHRAAEGGNQGRRTKERDRHRTGQSASRVRAFLQSRGGLRSRVLSVSSDLLSAVGLLCRGRGDFLRRRRDDGSVLGRRCGAAAGAATTSTSTTTSINFNRNHATSTAGNRWIGESAAGAAAASAETGDNWTHNPEHRGGTPYRDRATADRFGGSARGDSLSQRRASAQQRIGRQGGNLASNRASGAGLGNRAGGAGVSDRARASALAIAPVAPVLAIAREQAEPIASAAGIFAQRWRKPGCVRRRIQGIQRIERAQQQQSRLLQHVSRGGGGFSRGGGGGGGAAQIGSLAGKESQEHRHEINICE